MLFNSDTFIFLFLPLALAGFFTFSRFGKPWGAGWLAACSFAFYGYWDPHYLLLLVGSILANFAAGRALAQPLDRNDRTRSHVLTVAVAANLAMLVYFKYFGFFMTNFRAATGLSWSFGHIVLPLGISFFTFTQIAYLIDARRGKANEASLLHYVLFVTYFPHLIAGPILHHGEMMPQFQRDDVYVWNTERFVTGLVIFAMGLAKKVVLADGAATYAFPAFSALADGYHPGLLEAWGGALSYTFQLYFDFSGYCDMAIGISWMFGIGLPLNFNSPYKSGSIIEFWRRWHMTLSRFLRDYLYIALGGSRRGKVRRYFNLGATMVIGGLWHGAGWNFIIWGALHGLYLMANHAWLAWRGARADPRFALACWALTFVAVVVGWVFFRAATVPQALHELCGMAGLNGWGAHAGKPSSGLWGWCVVLAAISLALPNTEQIMRAFLPKIAVPQMDENVELRVSFVPNLYWAASIAALLAAGLVCLPQPTSFLYFNF